MASKPDPFLDDTIQFPRLLSELIAVQEIDWKALKASMDLPIEDLRGLFRRAEVEWGRLCDDEQEPPPPSVKEQLEQVRTNRGTVVEDLAMQLITALKRAEKAEADARVATDQWHGWMAGANTTARLVKAVVDSLVAGPLKDRLSEALRAGRDASLETVDIRDAALELGRHLERDAIKDALDRMHTTDGYPSAEWCQWFAERVSGGSPATPTAGFSE